MSGSDITKFLSGNIKAKKPKKSQEDDFSLNEDDLIGDVTGDEKEKETGKEGKKAAGGDKVKGAKKAKKATSVLKDLFDDSAKEEDAEMMADQTGLGMDSDAKYEAELQGKSVDDKPKPEGNPDTESLDEEEEDEEEQKKSEALKKTLFAGLIDETLPGV